MNKTKIFGPVPSRRLGKSVGINNIPPKICPYSCVYCQLGKSLEMVTDRQIYYHSDDLFSDVKDKINNACANNESIDYLTIVPDGEPTLDINLGKLIGRLKTLAFKVAVITNSTLLDRADVRQDLMRADWVSVKIDALDKKTWRKIDRPHKNLDLDSILDGIRSFSSVYPGKFVTETMLVKNLNDDFQNITKTAEFIAKIKCSMAYLSIPTRPPAEKWVEAPEEPKINRAYQIFRENGINTECITGYEGNEFAFTGNIEEDILSITSVHPMREDAVKEYLEKANGSFSVIEKMVQENKIVVSENNGDRFYLRKLNTQPR